MPLSRRIFVRWTQFAALTTALCLLTYITAQQVGRQMANDPQVQLARDAQTALASGQTPDALVGTAPVALEKSLAPFVTVVDEKGTVVASSARLHGQIRTVPPGVFQTVRQSGEERVTWQPEPGVRMATVVVPTSGKTPGFVVAGRSLRETEERISKLGQLLTLGWLAILVGILVVVAGTEMLMPRPAVA